MTSDKKMLSLAHLEMATKLFGGDSVSLTELVALYLAPANILYQSKKSPELMEDYIKEASAMDYETAGEIVAFFTQSVYRFLKISNKAMYRKMVEAGMVEEEAEKP